MNKTKAIVEMRRRRMGKQSAKGSWVESFLLSSQGSFPTHKPREDSALGASSK